jgi:hypothetical protein
MESCKEKSSKESIGSINIDLNEVCPYQTCMCCEEESVLTVNSCKYGHVVCQQCKQRINKNHCLYCNPLSVQPGIINNNRVIPVRIIPLYDVNVEESRNSNMSSNISNCCNYCFIPILERFADSRMFEFIKYILKCLFYLTFFIYMGKIYYWIGCKLIFNKDLPDWFSWDYFGTKILLELFFGFIGSSIILGCYIKNSE